jgi:hypothetical protein
LSTSFSFFLDMVVVEEDMVEGVHMMVGVGIVVIVGMVVGVDKAMEPEQHKGYKEEEEVDILTEEVGKGTVGWGMLVVVVVAVGHIPGVSKGEVLAGYMEAELVVL